MLDVRLRATRARSTASASTSPTGRACSPGITQALGAERINIEDFELEHISPERGGTLTLLVTGEDEARRARRRCSRARATASSSPRCSMRVEPAARLDGHIGVPGDKSISHRALLIGALAEGETRVAHWGRSGDTESTLGAVRALGVRVDEEDVDTLVVHGAGLRGLRAPDGAARLRQRRHARRG